MHIFELLADTLDYPTPLLSGKLKELALCLGDGSHNGLQAAERLADARELVERFLRSCDDMGLPRLEEIYTATFDLSADCSLYAGYHLFGDDWRRSSFLVHLKHLYRLASYSSGAELPDHISTILRFLAQQVSSDDAGEIIDDCLIPTTNQILNRIQYSGNPYQPILEALLICLRSLPVYEHAAAATANSPEGKI